MGADVSRQEQFPYKANYMTGCCLQVEQIKKEKPRVSVGTRGYWKTGL